MDFERFSDKVRSVLQKSQTLATRSKHQSLEPEHLLKVMLDDEDGQAASLVQKAGGNLVTLKRDVDVAISKFPKVEGSGAGGLRISNDLGKILASGEELADQAGDKFLTTERILQAMSLAKASDVAEYIENAGMTPQKLNSAINGLRKGRTADTSNAEDNFEALKKFTIDVTQKAKEGKLDPVIGREKEIERVSIF